MPASARTETISVARRRAAERLGHVTETPGLDADLLLAHVLDVDRAALFAHADEPLPEGVARRFRHVLDRHVAGEPVAYITGSKSFRALNLAVDRRVLVPRPETEQLVKFALAWIKNHPADSELRVVDVGTGSGAIALAIADELGESAAQVEIIATDLSDDALAVARSNASVAGVQQLLRFVRADLLNDVDGDFDLILANLPYLRDDQRHPSTAAEPEQALFAGIDGFDVYRRLLPQIRERLRANGLAILEIDPDQANFGADEATTSTGKPVEVVLDLAERERFLVIGDARGLSA